MESQPADLPPDMIFEILTRLSLEDIGRCRLVSKNWNRTTYESTFMQQNCQRAKTISGCFIQCWDKYEPSPEFVSINNVSDCDPKLSLRFLPAPVKIEAATKQGILLCMNDYRTRRLRIPEYYVCKPSTKEWHQIPNPKTRYFTQKMAMLVLRSKPLRYKIVRFSQPKSTFTRYKSIWYKCYRCEIFDSETWAWKRLKDVLLPDGKFIGFEPAVSACGVLYSLMPDNEIFAFYEDTESWTTFELPFPLCKKDYFKHMKLVEYRGRLGMLCMGENFMMQLWVMEDHDMKIWSKRETISIEALRDVETHTVPAAMHSTGVALMRGYSAVVFYDFKSGRPSINVCKVGKFFDAIFPFQSDLEPVHLKKKSFTGGVGSAGGMRFPFLLSVVVLSWVFLFICSYLAYYS
ncbi:F-box protein At5g49610-like [Juglans microcarpa x Juglans regia]|uniref:F-box protein At5g49610-like n=1 Tax=Juglans microcarpa x Juglans regia TaxID=2249226 RepID=UPI001B7E66D2|nr:F-box protein At5g49610-like [Juglans microcarpa x Juglans regia]